MAVTGTEDIGIFNSSLADDIGSMWLGFLHLVCFSVLGSVSGCSYSISRIVL